MCLFRGNESKGAEGVKWLFLMGLMYFGLYLLIYTPLCIRYGHHWDELLDLAGAANGTYIAAGRWGLALYRWVFGLGYIPWFAGIIAGAYIAIALVIQLRILQITSRTAALIYGAFYIGCVQWGSQLQYSEQSDAVAFALLCTTVAVYVSGLFKQRSWMISCILLVYACAVYQTSMLYYVVLLLAGILVQQVNGKVLVLNIAKGLLFAFVAGCVYLISRCISDLLPIVTVQDMVYTRGVQRSMTAWSEILSEASFDGKCKLLSFYAVCHVKVVIKNLLGMTYAGQWAYATAVVPLCGLVWDCVCKRKEYIRTFVLLAIWILPFSMCILLMTDQGPRVSLAEPLSLAVLWTLWIAKIRSCNAKICFSMLLSAFVLLKAGYRITLIAEDEKNVYLSKMENLRALNVRLLSAADAAQLRSPRVVYFGNIPTHGHNYYKSRWNRRREESMLLRLPDGSFPEELTVQLNKPTPAEVVKYSAIITEMPTWPAPGCILVQDNVILLRFAD